MDILSFALAYCGALVGGFLFLCILIYIFNKDTKDMSRSDFHVKTYKRLNHISGDFYHLLRITSGNYVQEYDDRIIENVSFDEDLKFIIDELKQAYKLGWDRGYKEGEKNG